MRVKAPGRGPRCTDLADRTTLCGDAAESCPVFSEGVRREHWPLADPARAEGDEEEIQRVFREVRDEIRERVRALFAAEDARSAC